MSKENNYQYNLDLAGLAGEPVNGVQENLGDDGVAPLGLHDTSLFDENEGRLSGDYIDPATGVAYDNSTYDGLEDLTFVFSDELTPEEARYDGDDSLDVMPHTDEDYENDAAAQWLAERERLMKVSQIQVAGHIIGEQALSEFPLPDQSTAEEQLI